MSLRCGWPWWRLAVAFAAAGVILAVGVRDTRAQGSTAARAAAAAAAADDDDDDDGDDYEDGEQDDDGEDGEQGGTNASDADDAQDPPFFADSEDAKEQARVAKKRGRRRKHKTRYKGSFTSTTFAFRETAAVAVPLMGGGVGTENAAVLDRVFTDMRAQVDAKNLGGAGRWHGRLDTRVRLTGDGRFQSGNTGGREYDAREIYVRRDGAKTEFRLGRQFVPELAAIKIDGLRFTHKSSPTFSYVGFAGLYPARGSRSIEDDYPTAVPDPMNPTATSKRVMPFAGGLGGSYRHQRYYGSFGAVGIVPRATELQTGTLEKPRAYVSANGYYRRSNELDVYHFVVLDLTGAAGAALTNLSLGLNYRPSLGIRVTASINRVDTETLNVIAQTRLEDPDPDVNTLVQNNVAVTRIASESARVGVSTSLKERRFEVSASGTLRRRPEIRVERGDTTQVTIAAAEAGEITLTARDRRSYRGAQIGASVTSMFGIGDANLNRSDTTIARVFGSKEIRGGKGEVELDATYLSSKDDDREQVCNVGDLLTCYGTSLSRVLSVGALLFYRVKRDWFVVASLSIGSQRLTVRDGANEVRQPSILMITGFLRAAYRF